MSRLRRIGRLALALMRELADENAYARRLKAHGREASAEEWRRFCEERYRTRYSQPKCC